MLDRSLKPSPGNHLAFAVPGIEEFYLNNGLKVVFVQKTNLPVIRINLISNPGSKFDPQGKKGLANLMSMAVDEGAGPYDALALSDEFDMLGSNFSSRAGNDAFYLSLQSLTENLDETLNLFSCIIAEPRFDSKDFEREKRKVLVRLMQLIDDPEEIAGSAFEYLVLGKENPYSFPVLGYEEDVKEITLDDVRSLYKNHFSPASSTAIVVGDIPKHLLIDKLEHALRPWVTPSNGKVLIDPLLPKAPGIFLIHKPGSVQSEIRAGHISTRRDSHDYFPKKILNTILGGQFSSRINLNLREDKGYTYGAFSHFNYFKHSAYFMASASVGAENTGAALKEILYELNGILDGVTNDELDFAKSSLTRQFPSNFETYGQIASILKGKVIHNLPADYFDSYLDNIHAVTIDQVKSAAVSNIFPEQLVVVLVGDRNVITSQLPGLNLGSAVELDIKGNII